MKDCAERVAASISHSVVSISSEEKRERYDVLQGLLFWHSTDNMKPRVFSDETENIEQIPSTPFDIGFPVPICKVACGEMFTVALSVLGRVYSYGDNRYGALGLDEDALLITQFPEEVKGARKFVTDIACGYHHTLAITLDETLYVWGRDQGVHLRDTALELPEPKLAEFATIDISRPREMKGILNHYSIEKAVCGGFHSGLITKKGELLTWGQGSYGQLGHGNELLTTVYQPKKVRKNRCVICLGGLLC